ncbi:hypothetical protein FQT08_12335 [Enterococcus hirae]|nr:hypothetical protein [Enterococcus hirae]
MCCGNSILQKGLPFFYLHKIFYTLKVAWLFYDYLLYIVRFYKNSYSKIFFLNIFPPFIHFFY